MIGNAKYPFRVEWDPEVNELCRIAGWGIEKYGSLQMAQELRGHLRSF